MRRYETIIITDPDLSPEQRDPVLQRVSDVINQGGGFLALTDEWGARKLAYEIKKRARGYYIRFVLKYMTVLLDKDADIEKIKEEIAATQTDAGKTVEQAEIAAGKVSSEEPLESQSGSDEVPTPSEKQAETSEEQAETSEKPAETEETQTPEPEAGESETAPAETEEEKK